MSFSNGGISDKAAKVCHTWANQIKSAMYERGRETAYRIYFEGATIYSYGRHFPIATLHKKDGVTIVLFTNRKSTLTTNKHIRGAWDACSQYTRISCNDPMEALYNNHDSNLKDWERAAETAVNEIPRAKDKERRYTAILHNYNEAKAYADYFGIALTAEDYPNLFARPSKDFEAQLLKAREIREAKEKEKNKERIDLYNEYLDYWRRMVTVEKNGTLIDFTNKYLGADPLGYSYFRFNPVNGYIETTQQIQIPQTAAKRFLTEICPAITRGDIVKGAEILHYTLLEANQRYIRVGCHKITVEEINRQAVAMGWEMCK